MKVEKKIDLENKVHISGRNISLHILGGWNINLFEENSKWSCKVDYHPTPWACEKNFKV